MDPERLLSASGEGDQLERELLGSIRDISPPRRAKAEAWEGIAVQIAAVAVLGTAGATMAAGASAATASAAAVAPEAAAVGAGGVAVAGLKASILPATSGMLRAFATKVVLGTVVAGSTVAAGTTWVQHRQQHATVSAPAMAMEKRASEDTAAPRAQTPAQLAPIAVDPCVNTPDAPACAAIAGTPTESPGRFSRSSEAGAARSRLRFESQMLTEARAQLRSGDARGALATIDRLQNRSPNGILGQEREVLTIQALAAMGNTDAAKRRAKAFVMAYPNSPHSTQLRPIAEGP